MTNTTKAYNDGYNDGLSWDLSGFDSLAEAADQSSGWDESTINALGAGACARRWDVPEDSDAFSDACMEYNRGVVDAIRERMGTVYAEVES
jgi:hypothetical protein